MWVIVWFVYLQPYSFSKQVSVINQPINMKEKQEKYL